MRAAPDRRDKPRKPTRSAAGGPVGKRSRYIPVAVRAEVWRRDQGRCAFVGENGHVCGSTHRVQFHHIEAFAKGGAATVETISLRCASRNFHEAVEEFGAEHVAQAIAKRRGPANAGAVVESTASRS